MENASHLTAQVEDKLTQIISSYEQLLSRARALALFDSLTDLPSRVFL